MSFHNLHRIHRITHFLYETKDVKYEDDDEEEKTSFCYEILMCTKKAGNNYKVFVQIVYYIHNRTMIYFLFILPYMLCSLTQNIYVIKHLVHHCLDFTIFFVIQRTTDIC